LDKTFDAALHHLILAKIKFDDYFLLIMLGSLNPVAFGLAGGFLLLKSKRPPLNHVSECTLSSQGCNEIEDLEIHRCAFQLALVFCRSVDPTPRDADGPFAKHPIRT